MANDSQAVKNLISVLRDGEKGFVDIGEHLKHPEHRAFFMEEAQVRGRYANELEGTANRASNADVHESGTTAGALHRTWGDLKAKLGGGDHTLLETAEQGEDAAHKAYQIALDDQTLNPEVRSTIQRQFEHMHLSHEKVKSFVGATV